MKLAEDYSLAETRAADVLHELRPQGAASKQDQGVGVHDIVCDTQGMPMVIAIPNLLSPEECDELIDIAEDVGLVENSKVSFSYRTAKRTQSYENEELSERVRQRLAEMPVFIEKLTSHDGMGDFHTLDFNWRMLRYDPGDRFPAHQDQMDTRYIKNANGTKDIKISSHTILINLSKDGVKGGHTRFYPNAKVMSSSESEPYGHAVDVSLPRGWAIAFRQKGNIHAGQPVAEDSPMSKYVAQVGILRSLPATARINPSIFRLGPGLRDSLEI